MTEKEEAAKVVADEADEAANMVTVEVAAIAKVGEVTGEILVVAEVVEMTGVEEVKAGVAPEAGMIETVAGEISAVVVMEEENVGKIPFHTGSP